MAESRSSTDRQDAQADTYESEKPDLQSTQPDPLQSAPVPSSSSPLATSSALPSAHPVVEAPNSNPPLVTPPPPSVLSFAPSSIAPVVVPPSAPSFRPVTPVPLPTPQFSSLTNYNFQSPNIQNHNVQPPGVSPVPVSIMVPGAASGAGSVMVSVSPLRPAGVYQAPPGQPPNVAMRPMYQMSNGFLTAPTSTPQGTVLPPVS